MLSLKMLLYFEKDFSTPHDGIGEYLKADICSTEKEKSSGLPEDLLREYLEFATVVLSDCVKKGLPYGCSIALAFDFDRCP